MREGHSQGITQITMGELLVDPVYRAWFQKKPEPRSSDSWRVYAQETEDGPWRKRDFYRWEQAYLFVRQHRGEWYDFALTSLVWDWRPPVVRYETQVMLKSGKMKKVYKRKYYAPVLTIVGHHWCPHCRRPTVFKRYRRHHALNRRATPRQRCSICGIALAGIKVYQPREETDAT